MTFIPELGSLKVIGTDTYRPAVYDLLLTFHSNHGPISYRFRNKRRFQSKIANFSHPRVFCAPAEGVPLGIEYRRSESKKKQEWWSYRLRKKIDEIFSRVDTIHQSDGQTNGRMDRRTDTGRQQRPRLRIASRGKIYFRLSVAMLVLRTRTRNDAVSLTV